MLHRLFLACVLTAIGILAQSERDWLNQGVQLYKSAKYQQAVEAFQRAVSLNPSGTNAHLYLGTAFMTQWIPGAESPENGELARKARSEFEAVVELEPRNLVALQSLASLAYSEAGSIKDPLQKSRMLDEAVEWNRKIIGADPQAKDAYCSLGVIAWTKFYPELMMARSRLGMRPETPGPLLDLNTRQDLRARFEGVVEDGIRNLEKALQIDPAYDDAMAYLNLLIRERADLRDTTEEYQRDVRSADEWVQKALETKKAKFGGPEFHASAPPPPPPPPPPAAGTVAPQRIRVSGNVQSANLISKVDPVYPALARDARIQGVVRFQIVIGKDGRVQSTQVISGHPLLVTAAMEAVNQWVYRPTLLNGEPIDVVSQADVNFRLQE